MCVCVCLCVCVCVLGVWGGGGGEVCGSRGEQVRHQLRRCLIYFSYYIKVGFKGVKII